MDRKLRSRVLSGLYLIRLVLMGSFEGRWRDQRFCRFIFDMYFMFSKILFFEPIFASQSISELNRLKERHLLCLILFSS